MTDVPLNSPGILCRRKSLPSHLKESRPVVFNLHFHKLLHLIFLLSSLSGLSLSLPFLLLFIQVLTFERLPNCNCHLYLSILLLGVLTKVSMSLVPYWDKFELSLSNCDNISTFHHMLLGNYIVVHFHNTCARESRESTSLHSVTTKSIHLWAGWGNTLGRLQGGS